MFEEMVDSNSIDPIYNYIVVPPNLKLVSTPPKVLKKQRNIRGRTRLTTIKRTNSDKQPQLGFYQLPST